MNSLTLLAEDPTQPVPSPLPVDRSVLLIDDDRSVLSGLARALRRQPYRIYTATSGEEAMLAVKGHNIDVVVADEHMPGMRGGELLAWIADHCPEIMRIVLTGHPTVECMMQAINEGRVFQFFTKPCNPAHLGVAIRKALEHKQLVEEIRRLGDGNRRQAKEMDDWRAILDRVCKMIARDIRAPLQAALRENGSSDEGHAPIADIDRPSIGSALESLARVEYVVSSLANRSVCEPR